MTAAATAAPSIASLTARDIAMFARIGVPPELLAESRVERVLNADARARFGIQGPLSYDMGGIIFPYFHLLTGHRTTARLRRDHPEIENGKPKGK